MEISSRVRSAVLFSILKSIEKADSNDIKIAKKDANNLVMNVTGAELARDISDSICNTIDISPKRMKIAMSIAIQVDEDGSGRVTVKNFKNLNSYLDVLTCGAPASTAVNNNDENWRYFWQVFAFQSMSQELFEFMAHEDNRVSVIDLLEDYLNSRQLMLSA